MRVPSLEASSLAFATFSRKALLGGMLFGAGLLGCDDGAGPGAATGGSPTGTTSAAAPQKSAAKPKPPPPPLKQAEPLDIPAIEKALKCAGKTSSGPCPVLSKFKKCREKWSPITQSGDGRWIGKGSVVKKSAFVDQFYVLRTRRVPLADVAPGALGVKIALTEMPPEFTSTAGKAFRALDRGDVVKKNNQAVQYLHERTDWPEAYALQAGDHQIFVSAGAGTFLCGDPSSQALHAIRRSGTPEHPADGIYVTLYPTKW